MAIRSFRTEEGVSWRVWNVIPGRRADAERRAGDDRRSPDPVIRYTGPERRTTPDRRRGSPSPLVSAGFASGWLAFESPAEKRRLAPIPQRWDELADAELERLCNAARPVEPVSLPSRDPPAA